ncbi:DUF72 domain-containing protein (plasmid) [Legionella sp. D16C41]|uniref:DUF72 domain-containing protein n=1 Tax=Legionella sp. D16C41 TaxID=3402688 RepID=UPI003AF6C1A2
MTKEKDWERAERRAKREARRQKQREANISRAQKMHSARIAAADIACHTTELPAINIGCSGWFYWHWRGQFYSTDMPTTNWFNYYSDNFKTVELNAPFYSWPTLANVAAWQRQAAHKEFIYTVKVCELITHIKRFIDTETLIYDFGYIADLLQARMGCFLYQLPPSFHYTPERLHKIVIQLDPRRRNVVEFRHISWWNEEVYTAFRQAGIIFCSCSSPSLPDELVATTDEVYIRFHGKEKWYWYDYSENELTTWAARIVQSGAKRIWAYFNNDREGYAINNAKTFIKILKKLHRYP